MSPEKPDKTAPKRDRFPIVIRNGSVSAKIYRVWRLYKRKGGRKQRREVYSLAFGSAEGRKVSQYGKLSSAKAQARLAVDQIAAGEAEGALMTKADRAELMRARDVAADTSVLNALEQWKKARDLVGEEMIAACEAWAQRKTKLEHITINDAVEKFLADKRSDGVNTENSYEGVFDKFRADFGTRFLDKIHVRELNTWLKAVVVPATRNTYRKRIVTLFRWAKDQEYLPRDATTEAEMTKAISEPPPPRAVISPATFTTWLDGCLLAHPEYVPAMSLAGFCGMRSIEVDRQVWEDINLGEGHLNVTAAKKGTAQDRYIKIQPVLKAWLELTPRKERKGLIHPYDTQIMTLVRNFGRRELKLNLPSNCLRKSWVSYRLAITKDVAATSLDGGHSSQVEIRNYRGKVKESVALEWFNIFPPVQRARERLKSPQWISKCNHSVYRGLASFWPEEMHIEFSKVRLLPADQQGKALARVLGAPLHIVEELMNTRLKNAAKLERRRNPAPVVPLESAG